MELKDFMINHKNWEELLTNEPYNLKVSRKDGFVLLKYNQITSDFSIPLVREARGIIFKEDTLKVVCRGFDKFFNYGEPNAATIRWDTAEVLEKVDGSLIKIWKYDGKLRISTNGTIDAYDAESGIGRSYGDFVFEILTTDQKIFLEKSLDEGITVLFEFVSPYTQVVIPYNELKLYFLGVRENKSKREFSIEELELMDWYKVFYDYPKRYKLRTLEDVCAVAENLPWDEEGFVVVDKHFNRIKIKSPEYIKAHYTRNNGVITVPHLITVVIEGEEQEFLSYCGEYKEELMYIKNEMNGLRLYLDEAITEFFCVIDKPKKEFALYIHDNIPNLMWDFCFKFYDKKVLNGDEYTKSWNADKWAKNLKSFKEIRDEEEKETIGI